MTAATGRRVSMASLQLNDRPHALYRFYDRTDVLLYVGITVDLPTRIKQHLSGKTWWAQVANMRVEHYATRDEALKAERVAIEAEGPLYNDQHNSMVALPSRAERRYLEACGEDCTDRCREHHGIGLDCIGRDDLALIVIDAIKDELRETGWFESAVKLAKDDLNLEDDERSYAEETSEVPIVALEMLSELINSLRQFRYVADRFVAELPPRIRRDAVEATRRDFQCAGLPDATWNEELPHVVRHVGHILARQSMVKGAAR